MNEPTKAPLPTPMTKKSSSNSQLIMIIVVVGLILVGVGFGSWWYFSQSGSQKFNSSTKSTPPPSLSKSTILPRKEFPIPVDAKAIQSAVMTYVIHTYIEDLKEFQPDANTPKALRWITIRFKAEDFAPNFQLTEATKYFSKTGDKKVPATFASLKKGQPISITLSYFSKKQVWEVKDVTILPTIDKAPIKTATKSATISAQPNR